MRRIALEAIVVAVGFVSGAVTAQEPRDFCPADGDCFPDSLQIVFPPAGSRVDDGSPTNSIRVVAAGDTVSARVVFITRSENVQGWSYAVRHDPAFLSLSVDSVATAGTVVDPTHPAGVAILPIDSTMAVRAPGDPGGPIAGFISAVVLTFIADTELPLGRQAVCNAWYTVVEEPATATVIRFADRELGAPNDPPVAISVVVDGASGLPATLTDGVVLGVARDGESCDNGVDDDADGAIDCEDPDCADVAPCRGGPFARGDANGDSRVDLTDAVLVITTVAAALPGRFDCDDALDANDDFRLNLADALAILAWLFQRGPRLPEPFLACDFDPTQDGLGCNEATCR